MSRTRDWIREATAFHRAGAHERAEGICRELVRENPNHAGAWHLLGVVMHSRGDLSAALENTERALSLRDDNPVYWNNYGVFLKDLGRHRKAQEAFVRAVGIRDEYADAWSNLGLIQFELGQLDEAEKSIRYALRLQPRHADALCHLAMLYRARGEYDEALRLCSDAAAVAPRRADAYRIEGGILQAMKRFEEAIAAYEKALSCDPNSPETYLNQGLAYEDLDETEKARESFRRAAELRPRRPMWQYRGLSLCPAVFQTAEEIAAYRLELEAQLDEALADPPPFDWRAACRDGFRPSFQLSHHGVCNRRLREKFARLFAPHFPKERPTCQRRDKIRVGFTCTRSHEGGFVRGFGGIMERLDRKSFQVVGLVSRGILPFCRKRVRSDDVIWLGFPHRMEPAFQVFAQAECDLIMHWHAGTDTMNYFLPFLPLAPVQCIGFGTHGTTGIANIDFFVSSCLFERGDDAADDYTEDLVQFEGLTAWQRRPSAPERASRANFGLPETGALYFCPHRHAKLHPDFDQILGQILADDTTGHVVILQRKRRRSAEALRTRIARSLGHTLGKRILFLPFQKPPEYYRLLGLMDVVLDAPVYSASLTGYDAFGLGVPLVTLPGAQMVQRYAYGLCTQMGVSKLIASDAREYVRLAMRLGREEGFRRSIHEQILDRCDRLFETETVVREYERFFVQAVSQMRA